MNKRKLINLWKHLCESSQFKGERRTNTIIQYDRNTWQFFVKDKGVVRIANSDGFRIMMFPSKETAKEFDLPELVEYRLTEYEYNELRLLYQS